MAATNGTTHKFFEVKPRMAGKVGAAGVASDSATTIPHNFVGLTNGNAYIVTVNRTNATGTVKNSAADTETFVGVVSTTNFINCVRAVEGVAQAWAADTVLEILVTAYGQNEMIEGIEAEHNQDGTHSDITVDTINTHAVPAGTSTLVTLSATQTMTNKTLTTPQLGGDTDLDDATGNITVAGSDPKRGYYIPATALFPATTNGCATHAQGETTTNKINYKYLAFDASTEEYAWIHLPTPDNWDLSTVTITFHWTFASSSGDVIWGAAGLCRSNDDALDTALGTAQTVTDTALTAGDEHTTAATSAISIGGSPAKGDKLYLRVYRDADAGGDTLGADAYLLGITVKYGIGQYNDA